MRAVTSPTIQLYTEPTDSVDDIIIDMPPSEQDKAEWLACRETWRPFPSRTRTSAREPYSLAWYEDVERRRYARHGRWIPKLFEFKRHRGERVLGLGESIGTDWVRYAQHGARVFHCCPTLDGLDVVRRNFELHGLVGEFQQGSWNTLPYASDSMDVVCLSTLTSGIPSTITLVDEIFRVLKPGGKLLAALPAKYSAEFWSSVWLPWKRLFRDAPEDRALYSVRRSRKLFSRFSDAKIHKRHLRRSDVPHLFRWMLLPVMERLMGRFLMVKTFKPVAARAMLRIAA